MDEEVIRAQIAAYYASAVDRGNRLDGFVETVFSARYI